MTRVIHITLGPHQPANQPNKQTNKKIIHIKAISIFNQTPSYHYLSLLLLLLLLPLVLFAEVKRTGYDFTTIIIIIIISYCFVGWRRRILLVLWEEVFDGSDCKISNGVTSDVFEHLESCTCEHFVGTDRSSCNSVDCKEDTRVNKRKNGENKKSKESVNKRNK